MWVYWGESVNITGKIRYAMSIIFFFSFVLKLPSTVVISPNFGWIFCFMRCFERLISQKNWIYEHNTPRLTGRTPPCFCLELCSFCFHIKYRLALVSTSQLLALVFQASPPAGGESICKGRITFYLPTVLLIVIFKSTDALCQGRLLIVSFLLAWENFSGFTFG